MCWKFRVDSSISLADIKKKTGGALDSPPPQWGRWLSVFLLLAKNSNKTKHLTLHLGEDTVSAMFSGASHGPRKPAGRVTLIHTHSVRGAGARPYIGRRESAVLSGPSLVAGRWNSERELYNGGETGSAAVRASGGAPLRLRYACASHQPIHW